MPLYGKTFKKFFSWDIETLYDALGTGALEMYKILMMTMNYFDLIYGKASICTLCCLNNGFLRNF